MRDLFAHTSAHWGRYSEYKWKTAPDGNCYLLPTEKAKPSVYDPMKDPHTLVIDALEIGMMLFRREPEATMKQSIRAFAGKYGLLGIMTALPTTAEFIDYEKVYLPKNPFLRKETMETTEYFRQFFPFIQPDFRKTGVESVWQTDDKYLAHRAMAIALQLDKKDSAIFYMLFNLRMDRESAALKWFEQYQQCELKGSDQKTFLLLFSLISRTLNASDEISQAAKGEIRDYIDRIIRQTISSEGYSREDMVTRAVNHMDAFVPGEQGNYPLLRRYCKDYPRLNAALMQAKSNVELLDYYKKLLHVPPEERNLFIKGFIDELIASANDQEKAVYEEIAYNETIIRCEGDVDKAKEIFGSQKIHDENQLNLISEMIDWVYGVDKENVSGQSRLNMFNLTRDLQIEGIQARTQRYRAMDRSHVQATINDYSTAMDLNDQAGETMKADAFYRGKRDETLSQIKDWPAFIGFGAGVAGIVGGIAVAPVIFAAAAIGAGYGVFKLLSNRSERKQAENRYQQDSAACGKIISDLCREHEALEQEFGGYDAYAQGILQELESA